MLVKPHMMTVSYELNCHVISGSPPISTGNSESNLLSTTTQQPAQQVQHAEMPTFRDLKSGDSLFFTSPLPRKFRTLYQVLHEVDTIQIRDHRFDARNNLCQ